MYNPGHRAHVAQECDLLSMHAPMFGLRGCLNFFGQGSKTVAHWATHSVHWRAGWQAKLSASIEALT